MASLKDWMLKEEVGGAQALGLPPGSTTLQVWVACMVIGGPNPTGYGLIRHSTNPYGRSGLSFDEFLVHMTLCNFVVGWLHGTDDAEKQWLVQASIEELSRVKKLLESYDLPLA